MKGVHLCVCGPLDLKVFVSKLFFKLQILGDLWITHKIKKICKYLLTDEIRAHKIVEKAS